LRQVAGPGSYSCSIGPVPSGRGSGPSVLESTCADCLNYSAMRLGALPNGSWRILRAKYGANDEGFLAAASGIHRFNSVGGDLGHVYVVAAQMSCGEVALVSRHRRPLAPLHQPRWSKIVKGGTAKSFDEALTRPRKSKSLNLPVAHAVAVVSVDWGRRKPTTSAAEPGGAPSRVYNIAHN